MKSSIGGVILKAEAVVGLFHVCFFVNTCPEPRLVERSPKDSNMRLCDDLLVVSLDVILESNCVDEAMVVPLCECLLVGPLKMNWNGVLAGPLKVNRNDLLVEPLDINLYADVPITASDEGEVCVCADSMFFRYSDTETV